MTLQNGVDAIPVFFPENDSKHFWNDVKTSKLCILSNIDPHSFVDIVIRLFEQKGFPVKLESIFEDGTESEGWKENVCNAYKRYWFFLI